MFDINKEALRYSSITMDDYIDQWITDGVIGDNDRKRIKSCVSFHEDLEVAARKADFVIEAVVEKLEVKRGVFNVLDKICEKEVLIVSNSSSIKISRLEDVTIHPERILNMHFYSNPWKTRILEVMKGNHTSDEALEKAVNFSRSIGVTPLKVLKESTGFIFNRVWRAIKKECLTVVDEGIACFEDVDKAWMSLYGTKMGPFALMDRVGLDVVRDIEMVYYMETGDPSDAPPSVLLDKIDRGELGVKTGKGFYSYPNPRFEDARWLHG
jgi:3-hydroxybutyryl-CoA dehydrogenase